MLSCSWDMKDPLNCPTHSVSVCTVRFRRTLPLRCYQPRQVCHHKFATNYAPQTNCTMRFRKPSEKKYCDSYDCPHGYDLVDDADDVECKKGKCTESQCCKKVCLYYKCPNYCTPKSGSDKIKCDYSGCTTDKCCDYKCQSSL